jgi:hypothetical protein
MLRGALAFAVALVALLLVSGRALAWQEAHEAGDDVRVQVDPAGEARVEHRIRWHVVRGPLKYIDLVNVAPSATLDPDVPIAAEDGRSLLAHAARRDERTVRVSVDEPRALMRGNFTFEVRWRVDLVTSHALARDGATWRLTWPAPVANDGFDAAHTVLELPPAPDPPQPIVADTGVVDDGAVATLHREPTGDVLELVRPHVARGEAPVWTVRLDPRALAQVADPRLRPRAQAHAAAEPDRVREASLAVGLAALALLFGGLVLRKARVFAARCAARGATARGLLPLPDGARATVAGLALAGAVALELEGAVTAGAACVALAMLAAALRAPACRPVARGPGRWMALRPEKAFAEDAATSASDALAVLAGVLVVGGAALAVRSVDALAPWVVVLDALALVPLLATGRASQLPPDGARSASPWLSRAYRALRALPGVRVSPWVRVPLGDSDAEAPDELRLQVLPRVAMPGVLGIEIGLAWSSTPVGWAPAPEVLARVLDASAAAAKLARDLPGVRAVPGRRPDERVVRLLPRAPTRRATIALARELAGALTDRREACGAAAPWTAPERRNPRRGAAADAGIARPRSEPAPREAVA